MQTYAEQQAYYEQQAPALSAAFAQGGVPAVAAYIAVLEDAAQRRVLYVFGRQALAARDGQTPLDAAVDFAEAGIAEMLRQAAAAPDAETAAKRTDTANVISYNLAADLADAWPEDSRPRERRHFERGLQAARDCVRWRIELDKGPAPFSMAYWAQGMHQLSLGQAADAAESFATSLAFARLAAEEQQAGTAIDAAGDFGVLLGYGYLGLARRAAGQALGQEQYDAACAAFTAQLEDEGRKEDAQFGLDQLRCVAGRYPGK